jgi:hypothetical protein
MMEEQRERIDVVDFEMRRIPEVKVMQEAFELNPRRPAVWLQRICIWILRKLGCYAHFETVRIDRHYIGRRGNNFMERLWDRRKLIHGSFNHEPTRLLIGAEDYARMMQEEYSKTPFSFNAEYVMGKNGRPQIMGLHVEVIPWMDGILLL